MSTELQPHVHSEDDRDMPSGFGGRLFRWEFALWILVLLSIAVTRYSTLSQALTEAFGFRQTQTAFQTVEFHRSGIDLLRPLVPVFGDPWTIPFEFPLFQAIASI